MSQWLPSLAQMLPAADRYPSSTDRSDGQPFTMSRRTLLRTGASLGAIAAIGGTTILGSGSAYATVAKPQIYGTGEWGAQAARGTVVAAGGRPTKILIHHTDTANASDTTIAHSFSLSGSIQQSHFNNGWIDSGQHFILSRGAHITEGRHRTEEMLVNGANFSLGAHCTGQNATSLGIENEGTHTSSTPPAVQWDKLVILCAYLCDTYDIPSTQLFGHRDFTPPTALETRSTRSFRRCVRKSRT